MDDSHQKQTIKHIPPSQIRQILLLAIMVFIGITLFKQMAFMLSAFLGAIAFYLILRPPMQYLVTIKKWNSNWAAIALMLVSALVIMLPLVWATNVLFLQVRPLVSDSALIQHHLNTVIQYLQSKFSFELKLDDYITKVPSWLAGKLPMVLNATFNTVTNIILLYFLLWFMLKESRKMEYWIQKSLPLHAANSKILLTDLQKMAVSNIVGIPLLAIVQGVVATIGYLMFGVQNAVMWGVLTAIASVIPFVGTMAAWVPITIMAFAAGNVSQGYWLLLWGLIAIGGSDNVIRLVLQKYIGNVHPIVTVFGVIIGINLFGFLGLIFGPLLISLFMQLLGIYALEFGSYNQKKGSKLA